MVAATMLTVGAIGFIGSGGAIPITVTASAVEGVIIGVVTTTTSGGVTTSAASAAGTAIAAGAITGATIGTTVGGSSVGSAVIGAAVAGTAATGVTATSVGLAATVNAVGVVGGPVSWIVLGTQVNYDTKAKNLSFDCWKPLLHDKSTHPSNGMLLRDVLVDPRIVHIDVLHDVSATYPQIILQNVWGERFKIEYVLLPWNEIAAHAVPL